MNMQKSEIIYFVFDRSFYRCNWIGPTRNECYGYEVYLQAALDDHISMELQAKDNVLIPEPAMIPEIFLNWKR